MISVNNNNSQEEEQSEIITIYMLTIENCHLKILSLTDPEFSDYTIKYIINGAFEMTVTKIYATAVIIATILVIAAAATTMTGFPSVSTVLATGPLMSGPPEQLGDNATTGTTTTPPAGAAGGGGQQQQQTIHITKDGTNSYVLSGGSSRVGGFDTTYTVVGERSAVRAAENLIISTITHDFRNSPTIGYIMAGNMTTTGATPEATLPNPFATPEQITERITNDLRRAISEAETNTAEGQYAEIKCDFGMTLDEMRCHHVRSPGGINFLENLQPGPGGSELMGTTNTTAPISPLEGE
jgi:hypothetical protein